MASDWREMTIGDFAPFAYGKGLPENRRDSFGNVLVFGSNGVVGLHSEPLTDGPTVIIGRKGTVGAVLYSENPSWPIDTTFYIVDDDHQVLRFKYYLLKSLGLEHMNSDSAVPGLNRDAAHARKVSIPPLSEQKAIAHILGTLDDKIELNRNMNETLEAMARAIFKAWFVDFEPVRAKIEGRWQRGKSLPGLPAHLYDLFPDRLVDSELGEIPEGWEVQGLDEIAKFLNGLALQKYPPINQRTLPVIKIAQLRNGNTVGADIASADIAPDYIVNDGDILFSWSGSLECILWAGGRGALNQHLFKVTSEIFPKWFVYFWIHEHLPELRFIAAGKATTMGHIQRNHLTSAKVVVSQGSHMNIVDRIIGPIFGQMLEMRIQSRALIALRDTLLPKLISGDLRINNAESFCGERWL